MLVAVAIPVLLRVREGGGAIEGGKAEENAFDPGVSREVAIGRTVSEVWVGLIAWGISLQIEKMALSNWLSSAQYEDPQTRAASPRVNPEGVFEEHRTRRSDCLEDG